MQHCDAETVKAIETECGLSPWNVSDYRDEAGREDSVAFTASSGRGEIVGFVVARLITRYNHALEISEPVFEMNILNLGVRPDCRRAGVATKLLEAALSAAPAKSSGNISLEVREGNSEARAFYARLGFSERGRRPRFYSNPIEDAILMNRDFVQT